MANRWLEPQWLLGWLCVLLMTDTASGTRNLSTGTAQFPAPGVSQPPAVDCRHVYSLNASDRCDFILANPDCHSDGGYLDYLKGIFCYFAPSLLLLTVTLYVLWLLYLFLVLGVTAAKFFCPNLSAIATTLKLSHNVAGVTFLAFGNGAPDIFSAMVASRTRAQPAWPSGLCSVPACWSPPWWPAASPSCAPSWPPPGPSSGTSLSI